MFGGSQSAINEVTIRDKQLTKISLNRLRVSPCKPDMRVLSAHLVDEPDGMATEWRHKGGCQTQKKAATPKSYDLVNI